MSGCVVWKKNATTRSVEMMRVCASNNVYLYMFPYHVHARPIRWKNWKFLKYVLWRVQEEREVHVIFSILFHRNSISFIYVFFARIKKNLSCPQLLNDVLNSSSVITVFLPHYIIGLFLFSLLLPSLTRQSAQPYFLHREMQAILSFQGQLMEVEKKRIYSLLVYCLVN